MITTQASGTFGTLGISPNFLKTITSLGFITPTPIQRQAIPVAITGSDVIGIAQTGTGKTLAFGIPMIQRIGLERLRGLVVLPTRELALQVDEVLQKIGTPLGLKTTVLIGGAPMGKQLQSLKRNPHIIIATPGRLIDHMEHRSVDVGRVGIIVLDEADRMLDMGFAPQMKKILAALPVERQIMLFSATMPATIVKLATQHMHLPLQIEVARAGTLAEKVDQEFYMVRKEDKLRLLDSLLERYQGTILVFSRTKHGAKKICRTITGLGYQATELHSNRSLNQRTESMKGFRSGKYRILVATDIAARGIDVSDIQVVINFDIPDDPEDYVHRIGRTGRAGQAGKAISFVAPDQKGKIRDIERLTRTTVSFSQHPDISKSRISTRTEGSRPQRDPVSSVPSRRPRREVRRTAVQPSVTRAPRSAPYRDIFSAPIDDAFFTRPARKQRPFRNDRPRSRQQSSRQSRGR